MKIETPAQAALFCTVRIETDTGTGTGFLFQHRVGHSVPLPFIVTNKHVVEGAKTINFFFTRRTGEGDEARPLVGERVEVSHRDFKNRWHGHPNLDIDVAILPFFPFVSLLGEQRAQIFVQMLGEENLPTTETLDTLDVIEEILFVGYPNGMYDERNLLPIIRRGTTATPLHFDYNGKPAFLIDASVFPGSSGSPVLLINHGEFVSKGQWFHGSRLLLLGVISQVFVRQEVGKIQRISIPTTETSVTVIPQMIDLGYVFKASTIIETITDYIGCGRFERDLVATTDDPRFLALLKEMA